MKAIGKFLLRRLVAGMLIIAPVYLSILLVLKAMSSLVGLVRPVTVLIPDWLPGEDLLALLLVLGLCLVVGLLIATAAGRAARERIEHSLLERLPGYALIRSLAQQVAGEGRSSRAGVKGLEHWSPPWSERVASRSRQRPGEPRWQFAGGALP